MSLPVKLLSSFIFLTFLSKSIALNNGLALTPPMGFLTWQRYRCATDCKLYPDECISDALIRKIANLMVEGGYLRAGYEYLIIDDCWLDKNRNAKGLLQEDKTRFPFGMTALINYVHSKGLKFGIYEDYGTNTCAGYPGLLGHEEKDMKMFAEWGIDYIKVDGCNFHGLDFAKGHESLSYHINQTGRPIVFSCEYPFYDDQNGIPVDFQRVAGICNLWRNYQDIQDSFASLQDILNYFAQKQDVFAPAAGPGHWNDPDMLLIGNFGLSYEQSKMQMALWAILAAPLLISADLANIRPEYKEILLNEEILKINQDAMGIQGLRIYKQDDIEVWARKVMPAFLNNYSYAIAFCNMRNDGLPYRFTISLERIQLLHENGYKLKDLYTNEEMNGIYHPKSNLTIRINPSGVVFLKATML
uniref:Alpha-galactosidase n=1 Tax=Pristhesancus plagipennis TaxID=1955184 RepID=A0A2K8JM58_PRIPG|nr:secreted Glycoside hydrolase-like protein [Pristhesancus plagipennis]